MWKTLKGLARGQAKPAPRSGEKEAGRGKTAVAVETTRDIFTAKRLDSFFWGELLGVRSFISARNALETRVMKRVDRLAGGSGELSALVPRVPAVIPRLIQSLKDEQTSGKQLAAEISRDPALLAGMVRYANSAFYRTKEPIKSVEQAMLILGRDGLRSLIAKVALKPLLDSRKDYFSTFAGPLLWDQAERCALACECLAKREGAPVFEAYLAGLLHKIGYKIVTRVLSEEYDGKEAPRSFQFRDWLSETVPVLSWRVSLEWGLPAAVSDALNELTRLEQQAEASRLGGVVFVSSKLSELHTLSAAGRIQGDIKRLTCRINGKFADACRDCYDELSRLEKPA